MTRMRAMRWIGMAAATAAVCVAVMGVAVARDWTPNGDDAQVTPRAVVSSVHGVKPDVDLREEAGMVVAGMVLIGAAAAVRRAA